MITATALLKLFSPGVSRLFSQKQTQFNYVPYTNAPPVYAGRSASEAFRMLWDDQLLNIQEQVYVILLDHHNRPIGWRCLFTGSGNHCHIDTNLMFGLAMQTLARGIIIAHNHPCGVLQPSKTDISITKNIVKQCGILNIGFIDHVILTSQGYFSFVESGLIGMDTTV